MVSRRRFMLVLGSATAGLWLAGTGLVTVQRRFAVTLGGACSFCCVPADDLRTLVGVGGRACRICDECIGLSCDILREDGVHIEPPPPLPPPHERVVGEPDAEMQVMIEHAERLRRAVHSGDRDALEAAMREMLAARGEPFRVAEFSCSFCDAPRRDVRKLISGPRVFICDACTADAASVTSHVLRA
jgi:hypothetical protein